MTTFRTLRLLLAEHRLCLERDVKAGLVPASAFPAVDGCYAALGHVLDAARVELEAAGSLQRDGAFVSLFLAGCARLARQMHAASHRELRGPALARRADALRAESRALLEHLRARQRRVA